MTRLLLLTPDFPPAIGGIQLLLGRLVDNLIDDFDITVVTRRAHGNSTEHRAVAPCVPVRSTLMAGQAGVINANVSGLAVGARERFDVVLSGHITMAPAAACLQHLRGTPFVQYIYADEVPHRARLARFAMRHAVSTIAISTHTRELAIAAGCPPSRLQLVAPGVDIPASRSV
ncbi:glycosyltransferase, partial [Gaiella sp.]|uniref:glycosyltransferase n=1 Tax=Gaiella sp. TaxID=2663207 RepID=UPI00398338AA